MVLDVSAAIDTLYCSDWGGIAARLIRLFGDFDLAKESAQEAFTAGVDLLGSFQLPPLCQKRAVTANLTSSMVRKPIVTDDPGGFLPGWEYN